VRVWFARLRVPVLRVAIGEPVSSPPPSSARRLIDRMGACVMGRRDDAPSGDIVEKESSVSCNWSAYPDTGRRVFATHSPSSKFLELRRTRTKRRAGRVADATG
jgi:hypothetical protein